MLKKTICLLCVVIILLLTSCGGDSVTTPPVQDGIITSFDQARLIATLSETTDTNSTEPAKSLWVYFLNTNLVACPIKEGVVKYNEKVLKYLESANYAYQIGGDSIVFGASLTDTLAVSINGSVQKTAYSKPHWHTLSGVNVSQQGTNVLLTWQPFEPQTNDNLYINFTNTKNDTLSKDITVANSLINTGSMLIPKTSFISVTDSTGYGHFVVTFKHVRTVAVPAPYAAGSEIKGNFIRKKTLRITQ